MVDLRLTHHEYTKDKDFEEIEYYLKIYNEFEVPKFTNPVTGKTTDLVKLFRPMLNRKFVIAGAIFLAVGLAIDIYILRNFSKNSELLSYVAFMCVNFGATMILPSVLIKLLSLVRHSRAKNKARELLNSPVKQLLPSLEKITDELIVKLTEAESPIMSNLLNIFISLKKDISTEDMVMILNHIFTKEDVEILNLVENKERFENAKKNFVKILHEGINYGPESGIIEDPKFIQFLSYSYAGGFLRHTLINPNSSYHFANFNFEDFLELYNSYCVKFSNYCRNEYGVAAFEEHVEERIMELIDHLMFGDELGDVAKTVDKI